MVLLPDSACGVHDENAIAAAIIRATMCFMNGCLEDIGPKPVFCAKVIKSRQKSCNFQPSGLSVVSRVKPSVPLLSKVFMCL